MSRNAAVFLIAALFPGAVALAGGPSTEDAPRRAEFTLAHVAAPDAAMALRAIAGTRQLEILEDRRLAVTDTRENLQVVERVLGMVDLSSNEEGDLESDSVPAGDTEIVRFRLRHAEPPVVLSALRKVLGIRNAAVFTEPALVVVRDTQEKTKAARELVRILERPAPCAGGGSSG